MKKSDYIFVKFEAIYGQKWKNQFSDQIMINIAKQEWEDAVQNIDNDLIKRAVSHFRDTSTWPPTISDFIAVTAPGLSLTAKNEAWQHVILKIRQEGSYGNPKFDQNVQKCIEFMGGWKELCKMKESDIEKNKIKFIQYYTDLQLTNISQINQKSIKNDQKKIGSGDKI